MKLFKRVIHKIAPIATSTIMLVGSVGFAAAADLADFPQPYIDTAGVADVAIVIGADASSEDSMAATDIQSALVVPVSSGGATTITGGEAKDIPLGYNVKSTYGWDSALSDSDIPSLLDIDDLTIAIGDVSNEYSIHEEVTFGAGFAVRTGLNISSPHQKYKDRPFLQVAKKSITYRYVFDETVKKGNYLANATSDDSVEMTILGKTIEITAADKTNGDDLTALVGEKFTLNVGESRDVEGHTVTLVEVGANGNVGVDVDGSSGIIATGNTKGVGDLRVKNHARIHSYTGISQATLIVGEQTSKTYNNDDAFIDEDTSDPDWIWQLRNLHGKDDSGKPKINVTFDQTWSNEGQVIFEGESLTLPNDHVTIEFNSLTDGVWQDYTIEGVSIELYNSTGGNDGGGEEYNSSTQNVLKIESEGGTNTGIKLPSSLVNSHCQGKETDTIYLYGYSGSTAGNKVNVSVYWKDHDDGNKAKWCGTVGDDYANKMTPVIQYEDATFNLDIVEVNTFGDVNEQGQLRLILGRGEQQYVNLTINTTMAGAGFEHGFGTKHGEAVDTDVVVSGSMPTSLKNIGRWEENTLTVDGLKIYDPKEEGGSDIFKFGVPQDENIDFRANIHLYGTSGAAVTGGTQFTKSPSVTALDTEITTVKNKNLISVGGSAINRVSAEILGLTFPTYGGDEAWQSATGVTGEGQALIAVFDSPYATGKTAMLVAGWRGIDSRRAGYALYRGVPALSGQDALLSTVTETVTVL